MHIKNLVDPARPIVQTCPRGAGSREIGTFVMTGRSSLPPNPTDLFSGSLSTQPLATLDESTPQTHSDQPSAPELKSALPAPIIEATGLTTDPDGVIRLVAEVPSSPQIPMLSATCPNDSW